MAFDYVPIPRLIPGMYPLTNVTPFTYNDGNTFQRELYRLIHKINDVVGEVNDANKATYDLVVNALNDAIDTINESLGEQTDQFNTQLEAIEVLAGQVETWNTESLQYRNEAEGYASQTYAMQDETMTEIGEDSDTDFSKFLTTKIGEEFNILEHGVVTDTETSQAAQIMAAFASHPGVPFRFPPGTYLLDETLVIEHGNSVRLEPGATILAGAPMDTLVLFDNGATHANNYTQDTWFTGFGVLDANLNADAALKVGGVIRHTMQNLTIKNPIHRGIVTTQYGAEVVASNIRMFNTGVTNNIDSVGMELNMSDCHFSDIIIRDFNIGVHDNASANELRNVHPWIGDASQVGARYAGSVGFLLSGNSNLIAPYADTFQTAFKTQETVGASFSRSRMVNPRVYCSPGNVNSGVAAANPGKVFDLTDGGSMVVSGGFFQGHPTTPHVFVQGNTGRFNVTESTVPSGVTGFGDYMRGVKIGVTPFTPTLYGSNVPGDTAYSTRNGFMEVRNGFVRYHFVIVATLGELASGNLRVGGLPKPVGASSVQSGFGDIAYGAGATMTSMITSAFAGETGEAQIMNRTTSTTQVAAVPEANVQVWGFIEAPFTFPS